ncbi:hypothetical protein HDU91_003414, partial [Kappamyces sp. JEL0680]
MPQDHNIPQVRLGPDYSLNFVTLHADHPLHDPRSQDDRFSFSSLDAVEAYSTVRQHPDQSLTLVRRTKVYCGHCDTELGIQWNRQFILDRRRLK